MSEEHLSRSELLRGTLDMLILKVAALEPIHGCTIAQRIQQMSRAALRVQQGSLYPALHRLERRRWLKVEWRPTDSDERAKFYSLTRTGRRQLEAEQESWRRLTEGIGLVLQASE